MSRNPNATVTLKHGDSLNLICTIEVKPALDTLVAVDGNLSGPGIDGPSTVMNISRKKNQIIRNISAVAANFTTYNCTASITPRLDDTNILASEEGYGVLNVTVGKEYI